MLVLGRKLDQKIHIPELDITIQILRIGGSSVRVGIDAPTEFRILRDDMDTEPLSDQPPHSQVFRLPQGLRHDIRNQLNELSLAVHLLQEEIKVGKVEDAGNTFENMVRSLQQISSSQVLSRSGIPVQPPSSSTALLAEDQANEREMLAGFLRIHGYDVATVANGNEALNYLESQETPQLALLDMQMPELHGASLIRKIRQNIAFDHLRLYGLSGTTLEENGLNVQNDRIDGWFMKPLNPQLLVDMLAENDEQVPAA